MIALFLPLVACGVDLPGPPVPPETPQPPPPPGAPPPGGPGGGPPRPPGDASFSARTGGPGERAAVDASTWRGNPPQMVARVAAEKPDRIQFAQKIGASTDITVYPPTYALHWAPSGTPRGVLVTLHGHGASAYDELYLWYEVARDEGFAILAVQWWDTVLESESDYMAPKPLYETIQGLVQKHWGTKPPPVVLHGFSRGSAQTFPLVPFDRVGDKIFAGVISNAGVMEARYTPVNQIEGGSFGSQPFAGLDWILACVEDDPKADMCGCPGMEKTEPWLEKLGAEAEILRVARGGHGGFQNDEASMKKALRKIVP